jgi:uncharacterized Ntn-hydrolase superfamily protein
MKRWPLYILLCFSPLHKAQDTFSILAYDSITREVGAAGASCLDLFTTGFTDHFICELFPDTGAVACQAAYLPSNQNNARTRMRLGDNAPQIIAWLNANDVASQPNNNSTYRQYGAIRFNPAPKTLAAYSGTSCTDYKGHRVGPNYTIHGNILLGSQVLDSMEARFLHAEGDLACKLMAAMQGAKMVGADTRCTSNNSSSLFAFLKVSLPADTFGKPAFLISLRTHMNQQKEPIDSLQLLFDAVKACTVPNTSGIGKIAGNGTFQIFPNPATQKVTIRIDNQEMSQAYIYDEVGKQVFSGSFRNEVVIPVRNWVLGVYYVHVKGSSGVSVKKLVIQQ